MKNHPWLDTDDRDDLDMVFLTVGFAVGLVCLVVLGLLIAVIGGTTALGDVVVGWWKRL